MLKILIITSWYPNEINPVEGIFIQEQANLLSTKYDVAVLAINIFNLKRIVQAKKSTQLKATSTSKKISENLLVRQTSLTVIIYRFLQLTYFLYLRTLKKEFQQLLQEWGKPDLIHAHVVLPAGWSAVQLGKEYNIPVVLTEHSGPFSMHLSTPYQRSLVKATLQQVNKIIAVSPALSNHIKQGVNESLNIESIGNLIQTNFFVPPEATQSKPNFTKKVIFLSICLLNKAKGIDYLLKATQNLKEKYAEYFTVLIGGDGLEKEQLQSQAREYNITGNCQFLGNLSREQVRDYMQQCDVFILPSLHETFGIVLGEAMSCGKPVISTYCGGPEFIVTYNTGILVNPSDEIALAQAMEKFIKNEVYFDSTIIRESIVNRFGEQIFLEKMTNIYKSINNLCVE